MTDGKIETGFAGNGDESERSMAASANLVDDFCQRRTGWVFGGCLVDWWVVGGTGESCRWTPSE